MIAEIYNEIIPPQINRISSGYYKKDIAIDEDGRKIVKVSNIYFAELCSGAVYQNVCQTNKYNLTIGYVINYFFFNENYTSINYIDVFETDAVLDRITSDTFAALNKRDFEIQSTALFCNKLQNDIFSQYQYYYNDLAILRMCGSITGSVSQNKVGHNLFSLGPATS